MNEKFNLEKYFNKLCMVFIVYEVEGVEVQFYFENEIKILAKNKLIPFAVIKSLLTTTNS